MHKLALSHKIGKGTDISDSTGLIGRLRVVSYEGNESVDFNFETVGGDNKVIDQKKYHLSKERSVWPFSELKGHKEHSRSLELYVGLEHDFPGFSLGYSVSRSLEVIRTDAKNRKKKRSS